MKGTMQKRAGFTLVEILIVLAVMGIIMALATVNLQGLRERTQVRQAATDFAVLLRQARTLAQRYNANATVALTTTGYTLTQTRSSGTVTQTYTIPTGIEAVATATGGETSITYRAPYGEVVSTGLSITFRSKRSTNLSVLVGAVGLTGKVVIN